MKPHKLTSLITAIAVAAALCAVPAHADDSVGKALQLIDSNTGTNAHLKLVDNGDGTKSPQYRLASLDGDDSVGKDLQMIDTATGTNVHWKLIDNGDGTFSPQISCPDCGGGGGGGGTISDSVYNSATWNGNTTDGASKNALRDYFVLFDSDGDGKVDVLDQAAGIPLTNSSGVLQTPIADNSSNWNTAYTDRLKWDGGATGLNAATGRTSLGLVIGTNVEAWDADLDTWATLSPSANFQTLVPHTFSQIRTDLGATTVGSNIFTLTNPSAVTWPEIAADNSVSAKTASQMRTDLGLVIGTNVQAAPSEQAIGDADGTWSSGKSVLRASAAMTVSRTITMPAANAFPAATVIVCVDKVTSTSSTAVRSFIPAGSDTINADVSYSLPAGPGSAAFETDGTSNWTVVYSASQPAFTDMRDKLTDDEAALLAKPSAALVATSNLTLSGNQTVDGVAGTNGTTIVVATAQSTGSQNGFWVMQSGAWTRPTWYSSGSTSQAKQFMTTFIRLGNNYSGHMWRCTTANPITIDTTATTWSDTPQTPVHWTIRAASTVTQANDTNPHAIFTTPTNGRITLPAGVYKFRGVMSWTSMSATSGNLKVDILGAGTATTTNWLWFSIGQDITAGSTPTNESGMWYTTSATGASAVQAQTGTACFTKVYGTFEVTGAGTLIPTQTLVTSAAAVLSVGSGLEVWRIGDTGHTSFGPWD